MPSKAGFARNPEGRSQRLEVRQFTAKVTTELESAVFTRQFALEEEAWQFRLFRKLFRQPHRN